MPAAKKPDNEESRLDALLHLNVLDSEPEEEFDALINAAALACNMPIALISLVDHERQWFKAKTGLPEDVTETSRDAAFCAHAILDDHILEVKDATKDKRFSDNPLVLDDPNIRFYAGAPIKLSDGSNVGTLCVIDSKPGELSNEQHSILDSLADAASKALEARRDNIKKNQDLKLAHQALAVLEFSHDAIISLDLDGNIIQWNPAATKLFGYTHAKAIGKHISMVIPKDKKHEEADLRATLAQHIDGHTYNTTRLHKNGHRIEVNINLLPIYNIDNELIGVTKVVKDRTQELRSTADLAANEARFRALSEASPLGVFSTDFSGACTYGNKRWQAIFDIPADQVIGHTWKNRLHYEDIDAVLSELQRCAIEHIDLDMEFRIKRQDASVRYVHLRARPEINDRDNFTQYIGSVEDITERRSVLQRLESSEERIRDLYESTPAMLQSLDPQGRLISASDLWLKTHGYTREEVLGRDVTEFMTPESAQYAKNVIFPEFLEKGHVDNVHYQKVKKTGEVFDVVLSSILEKDPQGNPVRAKCVLTDVTEELAAKRATNELLDTLRKQFIVSITDVDGIIIEVNEAFCDISKYQPEELLGKTHRIIKSDVHPDEFYEEMWQTISKGEAWRDEICNRAADGSLYWTQSVISPLKDSAGNIERYISIRTDISKRKAYEQSIIEQKNQVQQIIERQSVATFMIDADHRVLHWNNACEILTGCPADTIVGTTDAWLGFYPKARPCLADLVLDHHENEASDYYPVQGHSALSDQGWHAENWFEDLGGKSRYVMFDAAPIFDGEGNITAVIETLQDVTEQQNATKLLKNKEQLLKRTGEIAGVGGWEFDLIKQEITWSDEACIIHQAPKGYKPTLIEALNFYTEEAKPIIKAAVKTCIKTGEPWDLELPLIQKNGNQIWVRTVGHLEKENNKATKLYGAIQDINEAVLQREAIEQSNLRAKLATSSASIGIWDWNIRTNEIIWDDLMYALYGLDATSTTTDYQLWSSSVHPEDLAFVEGRLKQAINGEQEFDIEFRIIWPDSSIHYIHATAEVNYDQHGKAINMVGANLDVTEMRELANELSEQYESMRVTLQSIADAVITTDNKGIITWLNPVAEQLTGWANADAIAKPIEQVFHIVNEDTKKIAINPVYTCLTTQHTSGLPERTLLISKDGNEYGIQDSVAPIQDKHGNVMGTVLVFYDVTEQRKVSKEISYKASHDQLTGLINRSEFESRLEQLLEKTHQDESQHALLFIDLDQFKQVNDACGHTAGDLLLIQVGKLMNSLIRSRDTVARLGGDEFAVILESCSTKQAQRVAQTICDKVDAYRFIHDGQSFKIGASIGLAPIDHRWDSMEIAIQAADSACYAAKQAGKNQVHVWKETNTKKKQGKMHWAARIEDAMKNNHFTLYAQRIDHLNQSPNNGIYAEVLLRLKDKGNQLIMPNEFIPAAERYHLASSLDLWVVAHAISWMQSLDNLDAVDTIAINLSTSSVGDLAFHKDLLAMCQKAGAAICRKLCMEINETVAISNMADTSVLINKLHDVGIRIALDNFGAGASSFSHLKSVAVDMLKIDGQFINNMQANALDECAVRSFIDIAEIIKAKTVAKLVENKDTMQHIKQLNMDYAQGYFIHKPVSINRLLTKKQNKQAA